jgi:uncharacterized protein (TIGR00251 family)
VTLRLQRTATGVRIAIRVQPRSSRNEVAGLHGDALKVRVTAPAVEGAANDALVDLLAATFGVSRRAVTIVSGATSRSKIVSIDGIDEERVRHQMHS